MCCYKSGGSLLRNGYVNKPRKGSHRREHQIVIPMFPKGESVLSRSLFCSDQFTLHSGTQLNSIYCHNKHRHQMLIFARCCAKCFHILLHLILLVALKSDYCFSFFPPNFVNEEIEAQRGQVICLGVQSQGTSFYFQISFPSHILSARPQPVVSQIFQAPEQTNAFSCPNQCLSMFPVLPH